MPYGFFNGFSHASYEPTIPACSKCGLRPPHAFPKENVRGNNESGILFVGSAPDDDVSVIDSLSPISIRDSAYGAAINCKTHGRPTTQKHIKCCAPLFQKMIKSVRPNVIVPIGMPALQAVLAADWKKNYGAIDKWAGYRIPNHTHNAWVCPTYHPTDIEAKRDDDLMFRIVGDHLEEAYDLSDIAIPGNDLSWYEQQVQIVTPKEAHTILSRWLRTEKGFLAFDYETTGLKPDHPEQEIVSVSFCLNGKETIACMMHDKLKPAVSAILRSSKFKKVASNMKFEERWTQRFFGHGVTNWAWDTMLVAHLIDNRSGITSVKFQALVLLGIGDYDSHMAQYLHTAKSELLNNIKQAPVDELLLYNGLDSLLEYHVMLKQMEVFR